jgi:hypothetical protein
MWLYWVWRERLGGPALDGGGCVSMGDGVVAGDAKV